MNVLFVCTGNTCRSPMAEHLFRKMLKEAGRSDVQVASAGVNPSPWIGFPTEAREALAPNGVTDVQHKAQGVSEKLVFWADIILTMESHHRDHLVELFPQAKEKTFVLNTYAGLGSDRDGIRDPYGHPVAMYVAVLGEIKRALERIEEKI